MIMLMDSGDGRRYGLERIAPVGEVVCELAKGFRLRL